MEAEVIDLLVVEDCRLDELVGRMLLYHFFPKPFVGGELGELRQPAVEGPGLDDQAVLLFYEPAGVGFGEAEIVEADRVQDDPEREGVVFDDLRGEKATASIAAVILDDLEFVFPEAVLDYAF